ncbi:DUF2497 domain-containing protein [Brevundimonas sp. UBA7534]|uniref:DUF2497 domain-containing protein n=1 Tax=Brevundimonas sp. UBA7534 TaxID=1946138 RepID=UPI0025C0ED1D|nr:DUF2497 domain-containing protein [Brevundimonas sp. UBA7534]
MTDQSPQEPTMEEILASIRRIISEDEAPADTPATPEAETAADPAPEPQPEAPAESAPVAASAAEPVAEEAAADDDVLELTDRYEAPAESIGDLDVSEAAEEPVYTPPVEQTPVAQSPAPEPATAPSYDALVGESAAASAASAFAGLHASFKKPEPAPSSGSNAIPFVSGNTVEAMVAEMLRPMLKDWLDANLPAIVEAEVRKEVERIARSAG